MAGPRTVPSHRAPSSLSAAAARRGAATPSRLRQDHTISRDDGTSYSGRPRRIATGRRRQARLARFLVRYSKPAYSKMTTQTAASSGSCRTSARQMEQNLRRLAPSSTCCNRAADERLSHVALGQSEAAASFATTIAMPCWLDGMSRNACPRTMCCCFRQSTLHGRMTGHAHGTQVRPLSFV